MKNDIDGTFDLSETVDIIASGYEWICPKCEHHHKETEYITRVQCIVCECEFETNPPEHAMGK